jgi:hypothetical protein
MRDAFPLVSDHGAHIARRDQFYDEVSQVTLLAQLLHHTINRQNINRQNGATDSCVRAVM